MRRIHPPSQPVRNITSITMRTIPLPQIAITPNTPRIINPRRAIQHPGLSPNRLLPPLHPRLHQSIAPILSLLRTRPLHALINHLFNLRIRTWIGNVPRGIIARRSAIMILHQARVGDTVVCRRGAHAAGGFLHDYGEDEARVEGGSGG